MFHMHAFLDLGVRERAADLNVVLNAFAARYPETANRMEKEDRLVVDMTM